MARGGVGVGGEGARLGPMLIVVEDAHWLARCTRDALAFVARRLESDRVVLLAASPGGFEGTLDEAGPAYLELSPLDDESAGKLLDAHAPDLPPALRQRLLTEAAGNP